MAMALALVLGLARSAAYAAAMGATTKGLDDSLVQANTSVSQFQLSASEDGDALFRPPSSNTGISGMASVSRRRKADGKHSTSFRMPLFSMLEGCVSFAARSLSLVFYRLTNQALFFACYL